MQHYLLVTFNSIFACSRPCNTVQRSSSDHGGIINHQKRKFSINQFWHFPSNYFQFPPEFLPLLHNYSNALSYDSYCRSSWLITWSWARTLRWKLSSPTTAWWQRPATSCSSPERSVTTASRERAAGSPQTRWRFPLEKVSHRKPYYSTLLLWNLQSCISSIKFAFYLLPRKLNVQQILSCKDLKISGKPIYLYLLITEWARRIKEFL